MTTKEKTILLIILKSGNISSITPNELKDFIQSGKTLAWKYLERLSRKNFLTKYYKGKSIMYEFDLIKRIIVEQLIIDENF